MKKPEEIKQLIASFAEQITPKRLEEARAVSGIGVLPEGTMQALLKDHDFSVEDLITLLLSGWMLQGEELRQSEQRVAELEDICGQQKRAIDQIADQSTRLRALVAALAPDGGGFSSFDLLKDIAVRVEESGPSGDRGH